MVPHTHNPFRPVSRAPLSLQVSRQLREAIITGELSEGSQLPTEQDLTERFGVSRSTIREALRILQSQGLLSGGDTVSTARPRISPQLADASASDALENALRLGRVGLSDLVELRLLLEGTAAESADPDLLADARDAVKIMQQPGIDTAEFYEADVRFHISLTAAGGNRAFALVMSALHDAIAGYLRGTLEALDDPAPTVFRLAAEHAAILAALDAGDGPRARGLVHSHIWEFYSSDVSAGD